VNTIRRARRRPRVRSFNLRALWWLLTREAQYQVLYGHLGREANFECRTLVALSQSTRLSAQCARVLRLDPRRRFVR
jgi:hypothetical protein